jgi:PEP-CTERM motif
MSTLTSRLNLAALCAALAAPMFGGAIQFTFHVDGNLALLSPPPVINFHVTGTGTTSAGPIVAYSDTGTIDLANPFPDKTFPLVGNLTMTLASGDLIHATLLEHFVPPDAQGNVSGTEVFTVTGGTGMFANATGILNGFGSGNANTGSVQFGATGVVSGPNVVPEPASVALFGAGLASFFLFGRRRCRA